MKETNIGFDENEKNDDFLNRVNKVQAENAEQKPKTESSEEGDAMSKVQAQKESRRRELEAEMVVQNAENREKPSSVQHAQTPEEFEQQMLENQPTDDPEPVKKSDTDILNEDLEASERYQQKIKEEQEKIARNAVNISNEIFPDEEIKKESNNLVQNMNTIAENNQWSKPETTESEKTVEALSDPKSDPAHIDFPKQPKEQKPIEIITPEQAEAIKNDNIVSENIGKEVPTDDFEETITRTNNETINKNARRYGKVDELDDSDLTPEAINKTISDSYEDESNSDDINVEVSDTDESESRFMEKPVDTDDEEEDTPNRNRWLGGDGETTSFKIRSAKTSKILKNIKVVDTSAIRGIDISSKSAKERNEIYLKTVIPTLQPSYAVVPFVISGVVVSMSAFSWSDTSEICKIDEKVAALDPDDSDYIYNKNMLFIERREKQLDLFYRHIIKVSGYPQVPDKDTLFRDILKFPDFQQLFFGAYCSTFPKDYRFTITCGSCGFENEVKVNPKKLCFLLNKNINIERLNKYISDGGTLTTNNETAEAFNEFKNEELVKQCDKTFRIKNVLPNSAFIYELKIPSIKDVYDSLREIADVFRDKAFEYISDEGESFSIDSAFGLPPYLVELRKYLYLKSLMVAQPVKENKDTNSVKVNYMTIEDKDSVIGSIYNLSSEDYFSLINDPQLNALLKCVGIQHAIKAGNCQADICGNDMGIIPIDPEALFFTIAQRNLSS